jgi:hypothetical protein
MLDFIVPLALLALSPGEAQPSLNSAPTTIAEQPAEQGVPATPTAPAATSATPATAEEPLVCKRVRVQTGSRLGRGERVCRPASAWEDLEESQQRIGQGVANNLPTRDPTVLP